MIPESLIGFKIFSVVVLTSVLLLVFAFHLLIKSLGFLKHDIEKELNKSIKEEPKIRTTMNGREVVTFDSHFKSAYQIRNYYRN